MGLCVVGIGIRSSGAADVDVKLVYPASLAMPRFADRTSCRLSECQYLRTCRGIFNCLFR
jgi:hypothetical protein